MKISDETDGIWSDFLNPDVMRRRFVTAGLFIAAHEKLLQAIKQPISEFFSTSWTATDGWLEGSSYAKKVRALDPKGKSDPLRGSIAWLRQGGVIDETDEAVIKETSDARNVFAHELSSVLGGSKSPDFDALFPKLVALIIKIERWWLVNVETEVDPDLAVQITDPDEVMPMSWMFLHIMELVALGEDDKAWELYRGFQQEKSKP